MDSMKGLCTYVQQSKVPKALMAGTFFLSILETVFGLAVPLITMRMINDFSVKGFSFNILIIVGIFLLVQAILSGITFYAMRIIGEKVIASMRNNVWSHVLRMRVPYFDEHESGETMSRITQDTNVIKELITEQIISFITGLLAIIGSIAVLLWIDWKMTLLMLIAVPLTIAVMLPLGQKINKVAKANQDELASFSGQLGRVLTNIRLVKSVQTEDLEAENGAKKIQQLYHYGLKEARILAVLSPIMTLVMMLVLIALFGYGGAQVATGNISAGALVAIMIYLIQIIVPFTQMATFFTALQKAAGATERLQSILKQPIEQQDGVTPKHGQAIIFENVAFRYTDKPVLQNINFTIPHGKVTAFVSASGGGKTTIFSLLERFYERDAGMIRYGEQPLETIALKDWRGLIGYVPQESPLMSGTVRENVLYGADTTQEADVIRALQQANAWEFVQQLEHGMDTQVGESGVKLSGGQKQRIAIARALVNNPEILLLDEATSNLDNESESLVQQALTTAMAGRTTIIIAHRLSTITHADQILLFENGVVTGQGTHQQLEASHSYYQQLVKKAFQH